MAKRFYIGSVHRSEGTVWFTLVFEDSTNFFVEQFNDSILSFLTGSLKKIRPADFANHDVNGVPLSALVEAKLRDIDSAYYHLQLE